MSYPAELLCLQQADITIEFDISMQDAYHRATVSLFIWTNVYLFIPAGG